MNRFSIHRIDFSLLIPAVLLVVISLSTLFSIDSSFFRQQCIFLIVGLFFYFVFLNFDTRIFSLYSKYIYGFILLGFIIVLMFGTVVNGSKSWLVFLGLRIQVEEVIKPFFIIVIANFLASSTLSSLMRYICAILITLPVLGLMMLQPDAGTTLMYIGTFAGIMLVYVFPYRYYIATIILLIAPAPFILQILKPYQKERIVTLFNITADPSGSSYNAIQSLISIGSGGLFILFTAQDRDVDRA